MALRKEWHIEDIVLGLTVIFTFLYPVIITGIILFQETQKEEKALKRISKILSALTSGDCEERVFEIAHYTEVNPAQLQSLCRFTAGKRIISKQIKRENNELIYRAKLNNGYLTVVGVWELSRFRIIFIGYDKRN